MAPPGPPLLRPLPRRPTREPRVHRLRQQRRSAVQRRPQRRCRRLQQPRRQLRGARRQRHDEELQQRGEEVRGKVLEMAMAAKKIWDLYI